MPIVDLGAPSGRERWTVSHDGRSYLVLAHDGGWVVSDALCPHNQLPLEKGLVRAGSLVCPEHWYAFELPSGKCRNHPDTDLTTYPVIERDGVLYAEVPEPVAPLSWSERLRAHAEAGKQASPQ